MEVYHITIVPFPSVSTLLAEMLWEIKKTLVLSTR